MLINCNSDIDMTVAKTEKSFWELWPHAITNNKYGFHSSSTI